ncbi:hypothetical protein [Leptospira borgpetersenii]|uniref:hypothetical protein n=1 Tax=Leptospira borgpetersenii TaxID=174 RepID=UPI0013E2DB67|nr:hypothetical protein [Leptospira borgpetersenii]
MIPARTVNLMFIVKVPIVCVLDHKSATDGGRKVEISRFSFVPSGIHEFRILWMRISTHS